MLVQLVKRYSQCRIARNVPFSVTFQSVKHTCTIFCNAYQAGVEYAEHDE